MAGKINKVPDFMKMAKILKKDLMDDAEIMGMDFIHANFEDEGFIDQSFEPWEEKKQDDGYGLLRKTNALFNGINSEIQNNTVVFTSDEPYSAIHNEGGIIKVTVTDKMKKYFWYMFKVTGQERWKWMALTNKEQMTIKMPKRQYMGDSVHFKAQLDAHAVNEILRRFKSLST
jgi:phage gpG-like protein